MLKQGEDKSLKLNKPIKNFGNEILKRYYFHGEGKYIPQNIIAKDLKEATKIWEKSKIIK